MGLRRYLKKHPNVSLALSILWVAFPILIIIIELLPPRRIILTKLQYTIDDGKTWFDDDVYRVPPYTYKGQTAVRAMVLTYDNGKKMYCPFLMEYTPEAKKKLEDALAEAKREGIPAAAVGLFSERNFNVTAWLVKKPGAKDWVPSRSLAAKDIEVFKSPDGTEVDNIVH